MEIFDLLALKGVRTALSALSKKGTMRFSDLKEEVGYSTTTTRALKALEAQKFVTRKVLDEPYRPVSYTLTDRGRRLSILVEQIRAFED